VTPDEWFAATDPNTLLAIVEPQSVCVDGVWQAPPPRPSMVYRRLRLFATACARMVWQFLPTEARSAVAISERFAEGKATETDLRASFITLDEGPITVVQHAKNAAGNASAGSTNSNHQQFREPISTMLMPRDAARSAAYALATHAVGPAPLRRPAPQKWHDTWNRAYQAARATQSDIVRDIFPPPGYTPYLDPEWLTSTVIAMARQMDEFGDFSAVPILADALQDAGCDTETVLQCCRAPGNVHVRGNWVVDLVLASSKVTVP
jgi:hypothetical protein